MSRGVMAPRERLLATIRGGMADRVPLELPGFRFATAEDIGLHADPLRREIAGRILEECTYRVRVPSHISRYLVTPSQRIRHSVRMLQNGNTRTESSIDTPRGELTSVTEHDSRAQTTWTLKYPVETLDDIAKLAAVPWEMPEHLAPPSELSQVMQELGTARFRRRGICETRISSPIVCVAGMMSYEMFLELALTERELIVELTEICRQRIVDVLEVLLPEPCDALEYIWLGGSEWVTPPMASPALYDTYVQEQEKSIISYIHNRSDAIVHVHCHGHVRHALARCIERGADYTEPVEPPPDGDITMAEAKQLAGGKITVGGNIECRILCNEGPDEVERAVRAAFEGGTFRFVLQTTEGPTPHMSQREYRNYTRVVELWQQLAPA